MDQEKNSSFETAVKYIPYVSAIVYFFGFIIFTAHLSSYEVYDFNLLSFHYLKAGLTFFLIFGPVLFIIKHDIKNPTDKLLDVKEELKVAIVHLILYGLLTSLVLFRKTPFSKTMLLCSPIYMFLMLISSSYAAKNWPKIIKAIIFILPLFAYLLFIFVAKEWNIIFFMIIFQIIVGNLLYIYFDYGDKNLNPITVTCNLMSIIILSALFGSLLYKEVPNYLGGPKNKNIILLFKKDIKNDLTNSPIKDSLNEAQTKRLNLIYENENLYYLLLSDSSTIALKKELFIGELIKIR